MTAWRQAGLNYINYSTIAARILRDSLKPAMRADAEKRGVSLLQTKKWENGKPVAKEASSK